MAIALGNITHIEDQCALTWERLAQQLREGYGSITTDAGLLSLTDVTRGEAVGMFRAAGLSAEDAEEAAAVFAAHLPLLMAEEP